VIGLRELSLNLLLFFAAALTRTSAVVSRVGLRHLKGCV
jgi:hypothetical protein